MAQREMHPGVGGKWNMKGIAVSVAEQAKRVYESRLKAELEAKHRNRFVAIEPVSGSFFLGDKFIEAAMAAKNAYPDRRSFVIRIGHETAFHIGGAAS
jgi:hypothetical protein